MKILTMLFLCTCVITARAQTAIRYRLTPGNTLRYRLSNTMDVKTAQMGSSQDMNLITNAVLEINGERSAKNDLVFTNAFTSCKTNVSMPAQHIYDSTMSLAPIIGKRMRKTMTPSGRVLATTVVDTPNIGEQLMLVLSQNASEISDIWMNFGNKSVKPGESWSVRQKDSTERGKVYTTTNIKYHYARNADTLGHACAVIGYTLSVLITGGFHNPMSPKTTLSVSGSGKGGGTIYMDVAKGMIVANAGTLDARQTLSEAGQPEPLISSSKTSSTTIAIIE